MVNSEWVAADADAGARLDKFLAAGERLVSRAKAAAALERGKVFVNGTEMTLQDASRRLVPGDTIRVWVDRPGSARRRATAAAGSDLDVIFEDDIMIVINKPPGILSVPLERKADQISVYEQIEDRFRSHGKRRPFVVHRIDQDTSGLVVFAKNSESQRRLRGQFATHQAGRVYLAVVYGHPEPAAGTWRDRVVWDDKAMIQKATHPRDPHGADAILEYQTLETFADASLVEFHLVTGRRNQIRLQARLRGHMLVGEARYVFGDGELRPIAFKRQALHAWRLHLVHPDDGRDLRFEAPVPADFNDLLARLRRGSPSPRRRSV